MRADYQRAYLRPVVVSGITGSYTKSCLDPNSIPTGKFVYEVSQGSLPGSKCILRPKVLLDFAGTVVLDAPLPLDDREEFKVDKIEFLR